MQKIDLKHPHSSLLWDPKIEVGTNKSKPLITAQKRIPLEKIPTEGHTPSSELSSKASSQVKRRPK